MVGAGCLDRPVERGTEVVDVGRDDLDPLDLVPAAQVRAGGLGELDVVIGVAAPDRGGVAAGFESLLGVLADALEQPVAHPAVVVVGDDERLVDELPQHVDHIAATSRSSSASTASAAARSQPPAKTDSRSNACRSVGSSRS